MTQPAVGGVGVKQKKSARAEGFRQPLTTTHYSYTSIVSNHYIDEFMRYSQILSQNSIIEISESRKDKTNVPWRANQTNRFAEQ